MGLTNKTKLLRPFLLAMSLISAGCVAKTQDLGQTKPDLSSTVSLNPVSDELKNKIIGSKGPVIIEAGEEKIQLSGQMSRLYRLKEFQPLWTSKGEVLPQANTFISLIEGAETEGLRPSDYHLNDIKATLGKIQTSSGSVGPNILARFDLLLTDAFILYVSHLLDGRVEPQGVDLSWIKNPDKLDFNRIRELGLGSGQFQRYISDYENPLYRRMRSALVNYKIIQANGGWPIVPPGPKIERGHRGQRVRLLRERLIATGDLGDQPKTKGDIYDKNIEIGVRKFQRRHGLTEDGVVGPYTLTELNVTVQERIEQIKINMERYRWMPRDMGPRYIELNIPDFHLDIIENGKIMLTMPVVVGKPYWNTPLFSANMTYIILNPYWNIPRSIALEETLPKIREDPEYLSKRDIRVFQGWTDGSGEIDPSTIDWSAVNNMNLKYRFRQNPGPSNPLGHIKFMLPNEYNVYLHDTSQKNLFKKQRRDFSHGCIRVENPLGLAEYVLSTEPGWTREKIEAEIRKGKSQSIILPEPIPVYLVYFTAWVDDQGDIQFRHDLYGRDKDLYNALRTAS